MRRPELEDRRVFVRGDLELARRAAKLPRAGVDVVVLDDHLDFEVRRGALAGAEPRGEEEREVVVVGLGQLREVRVGVVEPGSGVLVAGGGLAEFPVRDAVRYVGDEAFAKQALVCLDVHPGGYELLVGLEDEMRVYRLGHRELFLAQNCVEFNHWFGWS